MRSVRFFVQKEFWELRRSPALLRIVLIGPLIQALLFGYVATLEVRRIPTVIVDYDHGPESRSLAQTLGATEYFEIRLQACSMAEARRALERGQAVLVVVIPRHFGRDLLNGVRPAVQLLLDGSDANSTRVGLGYATGVLQRWIIDRVAEAAIRSLGFRPETRVWYNPNLDAAAYMVPGLVGLILTIVTVFLTSMSIVRERDTGTLEQLIVTPIRPWELMLGKLIPFFVLGFVVITLAMALGVTWFRVPVEGSVLLIYGFSLLYVLSSLSLGLLVSTVSRTPIQALFTSWFIMIFVMLLSGFFVPIENMPRFHQVLSQANPLRHYLYALRAICLKGTGLDVLWPQALALLVIGLVAFGSSALRFRKRLF